MYDFLKYTIIEVIFLNFLYCSSLIFQALLIINLFDYHNYFISLIILIRIYIYFYLLNIFKWQ
jgi:hypothetical protein